MTLCFGDSITENAIGATYIPYLKNKNKYKNLGLGGDTLSGLNMRIREIILSGKYYGDEKIILGIGANDALMPYLEDVSSEWIIIADELRKRGSVAAKDADTFEKQYEELILFLKDKNKELIIFNIPYIENNKANLNKRIEEYNDKIKSLCSKHDIPYVDFYKWQKETVENAAALGLKKKVYPKNETPFKDLISNIDEGLYLTIDGCHINEYAAENLARLIEEKI